MPPSISKEIPAMSNDDTNVKIKINHQLQEPVLFRVIYLNDDVTSLEFVIDSLIQWFNYSDQEAQDVAVEIHQTGSAVVAVLPFEIAEQKGIEITMQARAQHFPLQIKLEPEAV
jgi:ATP-dependent Clp protease adaptor protein ClpS